MRNALCPITLLRPLIPHRSHSTGLSFVLCHCPCCTAAQLSSSSLLPNRPTTIHCFSIQPLQYRLYLCVFFGSKLLGIIVAWPVHTGITLEKRKRHWKSLFSRLICPLIHLSSSTSSVLTCPPPKDPLHASSPPQPAPRRRLLLPLFFQSSSSPPLSSSLRDPSPSYCPFTVYPSFQSSRLLLLLQLQPFSQTPDDYSYSVQAGVVHFSVPSP